MAGRSGGRGAPSPQLDDAERALLASPAGAHRAAAAGAPTPPSPRRWRPGNRYLGLMLPYTPLHHLLLRDVGRPLVMTSGNLSEEPIARDNDEALRRLGPSPTISWCTTASIHSRYDDSVFFVTVGRPAADPARARLCALSGPAARSRRGPSWPAAPSSRTPFA